MTEAYEFLRSNKKNSYKQVYNASAHKEWSDKVKKEDQKKARMKYEEFRRKKSKQESKRTMIIGFGVIVFFIIFITSVVISIWFGVVVFMLSLIIGFVGNVLRIIKYGPEGDDD